MRGKRKGSGDVWCGYPHATKGSRRWAGPAQGEEMKKGCVPYKNVLDK